MTGPETLMSAAAASLACSGVAETAEAGWYVYGFARDETARSLGPMTGVGGCRVDVVARGPLAAVVSPMPEDRLGLGDASGTAVDIGTLAPLLHDHERVLEALLELGPVLPMRFGVMYPQLTSLERLVDAHADEIGAALEDLDGKAEWGLTVYWSPTTPRQAASASAPAPGQTADKDGRAYLARKKAELERSDRLQQEAAELAAEVHGAVVKHAADGVLHGARPAPRNEQQVLLKASYLVAALGVDEFRDAAEAVLASAPPHLGLSAELTGPWPPYNFVALELEELPS